MHCTRCEGLMVADDMIDMQESAIPMWMRGWRCVSCGNIVDPLIHRHRMIQESGALRLLKTDAPARISRRPLKAIA